jgi:hypothetical protein
MDKAKIEEFAQSLPDIIKTNETELGDLLTQMNKHTITHMNLFLKYSIIKESIKTTTQFQSSLNCLLTG